MILQVVGIVLAVAAALAPLPPAAVERWYSSSLYLDLQAVLTTVSNRAPFALFDVLIVGVLAAWLGAAAFDALRRSELGWFRVGVRIVIRTAGWAAVLYLAFLALWGLNYRREPLTQKVDFDASRVTPEAARALLARTVDQLNALHDSAHKVGWPEPLYIDPGLSDAFERTIRKVGILRRVEPGVPKMTLLDWYFQRAGVQGMTDPYFLETLVNADLLPFERPLVVAHEWAHLAGFADEGEANFIGWLTCQAGSVSDQYSGWLFLYGEVARAVPPKERDARTAKLAAGPRADLEAIRARLQKEVDPRISAAGWHVYDRYLRANRVQAGAASYDQVVTLVLGTHVK